MPRNAYEYDDEEPGMQDAVERQRAAQDVTPDWGLDTTALADGNDSEPDADTDDLQTQDTSGPTPAPPAESLAQKAQRKTAERDEEGAAPTARYAAVAAKGVPTPQAPQDDEYKSAMRKLIDVLHRPTPDYRSGYAEAQQKDNTENRTNRILDFMSAGLRRVGTPSFTPAATNVSGFLRQQGLEQAGQNGELARLGKLAALAKPAKTGKEPASVEKLRAYLVNVGVGTDEQLAGMTEPQLKAAASTYGLKVRADESATDNKRSDAQFEEAKRHNKETEGAAWRTANNSQNNQVANDAQALAEKLGDKAVFDQRYEKLQGLIKANGGQVPGLGVVEGIRQQPGLIGSAVRAVSPPTQASIEGRKTLRQLAADYARAISGAGVSDTERRILNQASVDVDNDDSNIAVAGLQSLKEMYDSKAAQLKKGFRPAAVEQVSPDQPAPPEESRTVGGVTYHKKNGKWVTDG
jgi:hypothetical protein